MRGGDRRSGTDTETGPAVEQLSEYFISPLMAGDDTGNCGINARCRISESVCCQTAYESSTLRGGYMIQVICYILMPLI